MNKKAFTLIELLVVVLIIGILAAVALPQYEKSVRKTYLAQWQTYLNAYTKAIDVWLLANGFPGESVIVEFTGTEAYSGRVLGSLDIDLPCTVAGTVSNACYIKIGRFHAGCSAGGCWTNITGEGDTSLLKNGDSLAVRREPEESVWYLKSVPTSTQARQLVCQYWASSYGIDRMSEDAKTACAAVSVQ